MPKTDGKHFCGITDASGVEIGLTPVIRNGVPAYSESYDTALSPQFYTGDMSYGRLEPQKEIAIIESDHRGGMGLEYANNDNPKRYLNAINCDARFRDEIRLGPLISAAVTIPIASVINALSIANSNCEDTGSWTNASRSSLQAQEGTYSMTIVNESGYQDITWSDTYRSKTLYLLVYCYANYADKMRVYITDSAGTSYSSYHPGGNTWLPLIVSRTINAGATSLQIGVVTTNTSSNEDFFDNVRTLVLGAVSAQIVFNGVHYFTCGNALVKIVSGTPGVVGIFHASLTGVIAHLCVGNVSGTDYLFICQGWSNKYWYMTTAEVLAESNLSNNTIKFMCVSGTTFYGADTNSTIVSTTNPLNGGTNWATSKQIGEDTYDIVSLVTYAGLVYARKSDCRVYYINASGTVTVLINGQANLAGTNTTQMFVWREDSLLIPYGAQELLLYDGNTITNVSPSAYIKGTSEYVGQIQAITGDEKYIYVFLDNDTKVEVLALNYEEVDGTNDWRWHGSLAEITLTGCASAFITSISGYNRCYIGSTVGTESLYYITICAKYGNIASDTNYLYQTGGYIITSWHHYNLKGDTKAWIKLTLKMSGTTSAIYWRAYYETFGDTDWTEISPTPTFFKTSPSTSAYIPVDSGSNKPVSNMIRFKFEGVTGTNTISPVLLAYDVRGIWYPTEKKMISLQVRVKDNLPNEQGQTDDQLGSTIRSTLDNLNSSSWPRAFYPPYWESATDTIYVKKLPLPEGRRPLQMVQNERDKSSEWVYELNLEVVTLS